MSQLEKFRSSKYISVFTIALFIGVLFGFGASVWATSIGTDLSVSGNGTITGSLTVTSNAIINTTSATTTLSTGGFNVGSGQFIVQQTSGLIGVGSTSPAQTLSVGGSLFVGASTGGGTIGGFGVGKATTTAGAIENTGNVLFGDAATDIAMFASGDIRYNNIGTTTISQVNVAGWSIATSTSPAPLVRFDTSNTRVGIATGTPTATFTVNGDTYVTGGFALGEGAATTTKGVLETASSSGVSLFKTDVNIVSAGTSTLRLSPAGVERGGCIEFKMNGSTFALYATSAGPAMIRAEACE